MTCLTRCCWVLTVDVFVSCAHGSPPASLAEGQDYSRWSRRDWVDPPKPFRPMIRWWWPGGNVSDSGIAAELALLDDLGFGGVEVQPFAFGLRREEAAAPSVRTVGTVPFIARLDYALAEARRRGMRADLTMSSGWGLGGLLDCSDCGTHQLLMSELDVQGPGDIDVAIPRPTSTAYDTHPAARGLGLAGEFDANLQLVAVVMGRLQESGTSPATGPAEIRELTDVTKLVRDGRLRVAVPPGRSRVFAIFRNLTNTRLAGAAYPGDRERFRTVDHLDSRGLAAFERGYFEPLTKTLRATPDHYFVDSFEFLADLPWTPSFRGAFMRARGYDITPYLPLLFLQSGEYSFVERTEPRATMGHVGERVREDYVDVRAELFRSRFVEPLIGMTHASGARLRLQALGAYGDYLDVFGAVDVPEAEDFGLGGRSEFLKLASSAAHVAGRRLASNEAFVGIAQSSTALTEDDYHRAAGRALAAGLNQLVYHGRAYPTTVDARARWYPFEPINITTRLDESNPVWPRLAHLNATFARLAYAMTRGRPSAQVAWLLTELRPPEFDVTIQADSPAAPVEGGPYRELSAVTRMLRRHAIGFDRVSRRALTTSTRICDGRACIGEAVYDMVLVDHAAVASIEWLDRLRELAAAGVPVVFIGSTVVRARGFADSAARDAAVRRVMAQLERLPAYRRAATGDDLAPILRELAGRRSMRPADPDRWPFATAERSLPSEDVLFIFNGTASAEVADLEVLRSHEVVILDPEDPTTEQRVALGESTRLRVALPAGRSRIVRLLRAP